MEKGYEVTNFDIMSPHRSDREARPGDYRGKIVSSDKAKKELGWEPKVDIEEGIKRYIDWYKKHMY